jgi:type II secretory ATPase GspE/PulE/Tfp pilus assembly ATPase PilB-like protein
MSVPALQRDAANGAIAISELQGAIQEALGKGELGATEAVNVVLTQAVFHGASDVHFEPWHAAISIRFRIDGILHEVGRIPAEFQAKVISRIKVLADMVVYQREVPQDGRIDSEQTGGGHAMRVSSFPTVTGEKIVVRVLGIIHELLDLDSLGFTPAIVDKLREILSRQQGTLLLTGPSSSGKTTTIYALLRDLKRSSDRTTNIVTIEDPVEYNLKDIAQSQVSAGTGFTFDMALRSILRQDPEVIMVGEIRDAETSKMAIQAGLTGHLVISTIHSGSAAGVFTRLIDMGIEPYLVASSLSGVLAQRLVRINCPSCLEQYDPDRRALAKLGQADAAGPFYRGKGCDVCQGIGYRGRAAIGELLIVGPQLSELVLQRATTGALQAAAVNEGMTVLSQSGWQMVTSGQTTPEELHRVAPTTAL